MEMEKEKQHRTTQTRSRQRQLEEGKLAPVLILILNLKLGLQVFFPFHSGLSPRSSLCGNHHKVGDKFSLFIIKIKIVNIARGYPLVYSILCLSKIFYNIFFSC